LDVCRLCGQAASGAGAEAGKLCAACAASFRDELARRARVIEDCRALLVRDATFPTRLAHCDLLLDNARLLLPYEDKGLETLEPPPSDLLRRYQVQRERIVMEAVTAYTELASLRAEHADSIEAKVDTLVTGLRRLDGLARELADPSQVAPFEQTLMILAHEAHLDDLVLRKVGEPGPS